MSWVRYDDLEPNHPKVREMGPLRPLAHFLAHRIRCHCSAHLTDGRFTMSDVRLEAPHLELDQYRVGGKAVTVEHLTNLLINMGLWDRVSDHLLEVHDYLKYNPSRAAVLAKRQKDSRRKREGIHAESAPPSQGIAEDSASPGPAPSRPSESEVSVVSLPPRGTHKIPPDHPLEKATRAIYEMRGCADPAVCHRDFVEKKLGAGEHQSDWHPIERSWAQRHDPSRSLCRQAKANAPLPDVMQRALERSGGGRKATA